MKKFYLFLLLILCNLKSLNCSFENNGCSAKAESLGMSFCAYGADLSGVYYNPATIRLLKTPQCMFSYKDFYNLNFIVQNSFLFLVPQKFLNICLGYNLIGTTKHVDFDYSEEIFTASFAGELKMIKNFYTAVSINFFKVNSLADASGYGLDLGFLYYIRENFLVGFSIQNLNSPILYWNTGEEEKLDHNLRFGIKYPLMNKVIFISDFVKTYEKNIVNNGVEIFIFSNEIFSLRYGMNDIFGNKLNCLGFGVNYKKIRFDYACKIHNRLNQTNIFTINLSF